MVKPKSKLVKMLLSHSHLLVKTGHEHDDVS